MTFVKPKQWRIGIDPDMTASGVALVHGSNIIELHSMTLPVLIEYVVDAHQTKGAVVLLEDVSAAKTTFKRSGTNAAAMRKIAQNVGMVKATAEIIREMLISKGVEVRMVKPLRGPVKRQAKANHVYFCKLTGWQGKSNQDKRDAALLALYGKAQG